MDENQFDIAAEKAKAELEARLSKLSAEQQVGAQVIAEWWKKWYMDAGHKRLGRIIKERSAR